MANQQYTRSRLVWVAAAIFLCQVCSAIETPIGGTYSSSYTLTQILSPYVVTKDLVVSNGTTLTIEAGISLNFQARVRLVVNGTLIAKGSYASPIFMYHNATIGTDTGLIRLVGGNDAREGRVEVFNGQNWGTVCDDYWNANNAKVVCRQLGFGDAIETSTRRFGQGSGIIGLNNVDCYGTENSLLDCRADTWNSSKCNHLEDVGVVCGAGSVGFWGGIVFANDSAIGMVERNTWKYRSNSVLENVEITDAGVAIDTVRRSQPDLQVPAITIMTASPSVTNVTISHSRQVGVLLNTVHGDVDFSGLTIKNSTSRGISGSCSRQFVCTGCHMIDTRVSGIDINRIPLILEPPNVNTVESFSLDYKRPASNVQSFRVGSNGCYVNFTEASDRTHYYIRGFETSPGYGLSISFQRLKLSRNSIRIIDGVTGQQVLYWWYRSAVPSGAFSLTSHQLLFYIDSDYWNTITGDILAFIMPYKLDNRRVHIDNCIVSETVGLNRLSSGIRLGGSLGVVYITKSKVLATRSTGIQLSGSASDVVISSTRIFNNMTSAIGMDISAYLSLLDLSEVHVEGHNYGLNARIYTQANISISNSQFRRSQNRGAYMYWSQPNIYNWPLVPNQNLDITRSTFTDAGNQGLYVNVYNSYTTTSKRVLISDNLFRGNMVGLYYYHNYRDVTSNILRNTFIENNGGCCAGAIYVYSRFNNPNHLQWVDIIDSNQFLRNSGEYVVKLQTSAAFSSSYQLGPVVVFRRNNVSDSSVVQTALSSSRKSTPHAVLDIAGSMFVSAYHNRFYNSNATLDVALQTEGISSLDQVNVTLNWWGTADELEIQNRIFDFDDSSNLAVARYFPFLLSSSLSDVAKSNHPRMSSPFIGANNEIGGQLVTNVTLVASRGPYIVTRDITVLPSAVLTVEAGAELRFQQDVGMLVEGQLLTEGLLNRPVIFTHFQSSSSHNNGSLVARFRDGQYYSTRAYGILEINFRDTWHSVCVNTGRPDYTSFTALATVICMQLGYDSSSWSSRYWYPTLGEPVVRNFRCPHNASVADDCSFNTSSYSAKSDCLRVTYLYCYRSNSYQQSSGYRWSGVRFAPTSSVSSASGIHRVPKSRMRYTEIVGAGQWTYKTVPAIQAYFRSPEMIGVTIRDCASTGMEVSYLHEEARITGLTVINGRGDGVSVRRPRGKNLTIDAVTVQNVTGSGIRVYRYTSSLAGNTDFQSICSDVHNISVDPEDGAYIGLSQDEHLPGITCSVILYGPPNTILSVRLVTLRLYNDDRLTLRNGPSDSSPSLRTFSGYSSSLYDPFLSSGNAILVEVTTGSKTGAPGFSLHVEALSSAPGEPFVHIMNSVITSIGYGVYIGSLYDDTFISNVTIVDSLQIGIYISSQYGLLTVANCRVVNSRNTGIYQSYGRKPIKFMNNQLVNNSRGMFIRPYYYYHDSCGVQVSGNTIVGSSREGLYAQPDGSSSWNGQSRCSFEVSGNRFEFNNDGLFVYSYNQRSLRYTLNFTQNVFNANNGTAMRLDKRGDWYGSITANHFRYHASRTGGSVLVEGRTETLNITDNTFKWNGGKYVVRLALLNFTLFPVIFSGNDLVNNYINETDKIPADNRSAVLVIGMSDKVVVSRNVFDNHESLYELGVELPVQSSTERTIDVGYNYWGTVDENKIRDRVHDFGYCSRLASADFFPYLTSAFGLPVSSTTSRSTDIIRPNSIIRGQVLADAVIPSSGSPYVVTGDISVLPGRKLTIEQGVELRFSHNTGILVEGQLVANGTDDEPIRMLDDSFSVPVREEGSIRITGGPTLLEGRVELFHNGSWGPVCVVQDPTTRFYRTNHDYYNTQVVCRELGYFVNYRFPFSDPSFGVSSNPAWLGHVLCRGNEASLRQCTNYVLQQSNCPYGQLVARCRHLGVTTTVGDLALLHWTGLRFAGSGQGISIMKNVLIEKAGVANRDRTPAVQVVGAKVRFSNVNVTESSQTGITVTNSPSVQLSDCSISRSGSSGVRLANTPASSIDGLISEKNSDHGLSLSVDSILQRLWNIPVPSSQIVDICSYGSNALTTATSFYLRFSSDPVQRNGGYRTCTASIQSDSQHVVSVHVLAVGFRESGSYVTVDGRNLYRRNVISSNFPLHYTASAGSSVNVVVSAYLYDYRYELGQNYFLAYVQRHPTDVSNVTSHYLSGLSLTDNSLSGLAVNSSLSSYERFDVTLLDSVVTDNKWNGIDINTTSNGLSNYGSKVHTFDIQRNFIAQNGQFTTATYGSRSAGLAMQIDKSNVVVQNNALWKNRGGAVSLKLDSDSHKSNVYLFDNDIEQNTAGPTVDVSGSSGTSGPLVHVVNNRISHNSAGIQYNTLSIDNVAADVINNTFFNDTSRHVIRWVVGSRSSVGGQQCVDNTLYLNIGQTPNYRWSVFADGVGPQFAQNLFSNPSNLYEFVSGSDRGQGHHDARNNWWGTPYLTQAEAKVRDKSDVSSSATVDIKPIDTNNPWVARSAACPFGWVEYNSSCYLYVGGARTWRSASAFCQGLNAQLASTHSFAVDTFLQSLGVSAIPYGLTKSGFWLGLFGTENGTWRWTDFSPVDYTLWAYGGGIALGTGRCLKLDTTGWQSIDCSLPLPFICKQKTTNDCPNDCSQHGSCNTQTLTCSCNRGWRRDDCSEFHCDDVNGCSGYGSCVGPNQCRCRVGWKGRACTVTYCNLYTTCHACSRQPGCGWCDEQQECIPGLADKPDKQLCASWFYYACYTPVSSSQCSARIRNIGCSASCDASVPTSSNETCQHCHDIENCYYQSASACRSWDEDRCPYGRVTPDYGQGPDGPKVPSHLPFPQSNSYQPVKRHAGESHPDRRLSVDLFADVRVAHPNQVIYRVLGKMTTTSMGNDRDALFLTKPPMQLVPGRILASSQSGGILDKVISVSSIGTYQLIKTTPAALEDVVKYADFTEKVELKSLIHKSAIEQLPEPDALQNIVSVTTPSLEGAPITYVIPANVAVYKCVGDYNNGTYVVVLPKAVAATLALDNGEGIVSIQSSGFIETVQSVTTSGGHTFVHTTLADCTQANAPVQVKTSITTIGSSPSSISPSITGLGGDGTLGLLIYKDHLSSTLDVSVGDAVVGRPSGPLAGYVKRYFDSVDGTLTYIEVDPTVGIGRPACQPDEDLGVVIGDGGGLGSVVIGGGAIEVGDISVGPIDEFGTDQEGTIAKTWCNRTGTTPFVLHKIIQSQISTVGDLTAELKFVYSPDFRMTLRSNHSSPFVSKIGFHCSGKAVLGTKTSVNVDSTGSGNVYGPVGIEATPAGRLSSSFCIDVGPICIPGRLLFSANFSFAIDYALASSAQFAFTHEYESVGILKVGTQWRTNVGYEYDKMLKMQTRQELPSGTFTSTSQATGRTASFTAAFVPSLGIEWPFPYVLPDYINTPIPVFITSRTGSSFSVSSGPSSFSVDFQPRLVGSWKASECVDGCEFDQKLGVDTLAGIESVTASSTLDLRYLKSSKLLQPWRSAELIDVVNGMCLAQPSSCACNCPGNAPCQSFSNINLCQTCACAGNPSCSCVQPCPPGTIEVKDTTGSIQCKCRCSDFGLADLTVNGTCQCGCTCNDGSVSVIGSDGRCDCSCKCNNCEDSTLGPNGCNCPKDSCPSCPEGLEPVWQDCVCSCQSKQGRGGLPPVCSDGWRGPFCDVPDCSPWPFCSDNGNCTIPIGDSADRHPYCVCNEQWIGSGCHIARPRPGGGDPHLQTLDGIAYDFFDIGEFWYCKSKRNDFGISTRFFKYQRVSLIGAIAVKAGSSVITITTPTNANPTDLPFLRINGVLVALRNGLMLDLANEQVHVESVLFGNGSMQSSSDNSGSSVALIAFQYASGVSLTVDVRYSVGMQRQFINILFSPTASFKRSTEGLCGYMDGDMSNDLVGSNGVVYSRANILDFAKSWRIDMTFSGSGLNGTWSWNHSNFHKDDKLDITYTDPKFVPVYSVNDLDSNNVKMARSVCSQLGLSGVRLNECIFDVAVTNDTSLAEQETFQIGCPTQCSGKGRCVNGSCVCLPGWFGDDCNTGSCDNCSRNGECVSGFCRCLFGWEGPFCDTPATCYGVANCTSPLHGLCKANDVCECTPGFIGITCSERAVCANVNECSNRGVCVDHDKCKCDVGWAGTSCSVFSCEVNGYCSGHGSCVAFDVCRCDVGWGGRSCALPICTSLNDCSGNGDCTSPGVCSCNDGYSGDDCSVPRRCPRLNDCSSNGLCVSQQGVETCRCFPGYKGQNCSEPSCAGRNKCSGHGKCIEVDLCACDYGYSGADCSGYSCERSRFCSGHGRCVSLDKCTCDSKWSGPACDIADCSGVRDCSNSTQGTCIGPDTCLCTVQYDGSDCSMLTGLNANPPVFSHAVTIVTVASDSLVGSTVLTTSATDKDSGKNGRITYTIVSSNNDHSYFKVDRKTGELKTAKSVNDRQGTVLIFSLTATDGGVPPLSSSVKIKAFVFPPNQYCPTFTSFPTTVTVSELALPGTFVVNLTATDLDGSDTSNGVVTYSLIANADFSIDSQSGEITTKRLLTAEAYSLTVVASDQGSPQCNRKATLYVRVHSTNTAPVCNPSNVATSFPYDVAVGTIVFELRAVDPDNGSDGQLSYYNTNFRSAFLNNVSPFRLVERNGVAYVEVMSSLLQPSGISPAYYDASLQITVRDSGTRPKSCNYYATVVVTQRFEFRHLRLTSALNENVAKGAVVSTTPSLQLLTNVSDVKYELFNAHDLPININSASGILTVSRLLDYERVKSYNVSVIAKTSRIPGAFAVASLLMNVQDVNDNPPRFSFSRYTVYVREDASKGTKILSLTAVDIDSIGGLVSYSVSSRTLQNTSSVFTVDQINGGIGVILASGEVLNYQTTPFYEMVIKAWDSDDPRLFSEALVRVMVEAVVFSTPVFIVQSYRATISENPPNGSSVLNVEAFVSGKSSLAVSYRLTNQLTSSGNRVEAFSITTNGEIRVLDPFLLDYERVKQIQMTVVASLTTTRLRTAEATVIVSLQDTNDNRPQFTSEAYTGTLSIDDHVGTSIVTVTATDADSGSNAEVKYDLAGDHSNQLVTVTSSGVVILNQSLDESTSDRYALTVIAYDAGHPSLSSTASVQVIVQCSSSGRCPLQSEKESSASGIPIAVVAGGSVGGIVLIAIIAVILVFVVKARGTRNEDSHDKHLALPLNAGETKTVSDYKNPLYQQSCGEQEDTVYECPDDTRRTSTAPLTPPAIQNENEYITVGNDNEYVTVRNDSVEYLPMDASADAAADELYEDVVTAKQGAVYSNVNTYL